MSTFLISLVAPFVYSLTNHIDKQLLVRFLKQGGAGTLLIVSALFSLIAIPVVLVNDSTVLSVTLVNGMVLLVSGILNVGIIWFYLLAMENDKTAVVIVFYQLVPVFGLVLGYFILDESISYLQFIAMILILIGATLLSFEMDENRSLRWKKKTVLYMVLACLCWALQSVLFKMVALEVNVWRSLFWQHVAMLIVGICVFTFVKSYRGHFLIALQVNSRSILTLNAVNEILYLFGSGVAAFAYMLAPVTLILLANSFQPIFVLIVSFVLMMFFPKILVEKIELSLMKVLVPSIGLTVMGTWILLAV